MKAEIHPMDIFSDWLKEEMMCSEVNLPGAVCLSTNGMDGFPNARMVSLKEVQDECLVFTGPLDSRKGLEIAQDGRVALTFWWTETERQVRVQGVASRISDRLADTYFKERSASAQAVSSISEQGRPISDMEKLKEEVASVMSMGEKISRPPIWGGFSIEPMRMEFMEFKTSRIHERVVYDRIEEEWVMTLIQP